MYNYDNLVEALADLKKRGYTLDFNLRGENSKLIANELQLHPEDFVIKEMYRFEGMSNPDDSSVLYAIEAKDGQKGVLVDAYGVYAEAVTPEMAAKLRENLDLSS